MPTIRELLFKYKKLQTTYLTENVIRSLLIEVNGFIDSNQFYQNLDSECKNTEKLYEYISRVESGEPFQYVIKNTEFCHLKFYVDERVLIPRNETEELVLKTIERIKNLNIEKIKIADICTGSGNIAIALTKTFKDAKVVATDISFDALEVAKLNNKQLGTNVKFYHGNISDPLFEAGEKFDVIISNPPYIKDESMVDSSTLKYEPHLALFAKPRLLFYENILDCVPFLIEKEGLVAFEIEEDMEDELTKILINKFKNSSFAFEKDMYGKTRFLFIDYKNENIDLDTPARILQYGGLICFPTETVMGLGVVYNNKDAYDRLNQVKNRPDDKPYTMMLSNYKDVEKYAQISDIFVKIVEKFRNYPMTFLLKKKECVPGYVTHDSSIIGVRVPNSYLIKSLIDKVGQPILVPSANKSSEKPAISDKEARDIFNEEVDYYIVGKAGSGKPSTIISLIDDKIKIIREGELTAGLLKKEGFELW